MSFPTGRLSIDDDDFPGPGPGPRPPRPTDPSRRNLLMEPVGYGFQDVADPTLRIYYPSLADGVRDATPRMPPSDRPYPVVLFIHGQRSRHDRLCPSDVTRDFTQWDSLVRLLPRCGFVVVSVDVHDTITADPTNSGARAEQALRFVRTQWQSRAIVKEPPIILDPDRPPPPPNVGVIGHSLGAMVAARLGRERRVGCVAALCGTWDDPEGGSRDLREARLPTLLIGARDDEGFNSAPERQPFCAQPPPVHQATLLGIGHWDLSAIHACGARAPRQARGSRALAAEMLTVFLHRYLYHDSRLPPSLFARRGQRPSLTEFLRPSGGCAVRVRWRDPFTDGGALRAVGFGRWPRELPAWEDC